jgi:transposase InsO family protein
MVVSWSLGTRPDAELVNTMLDAAIETVVDTEDRPVVHSDRGAHYPHYRWPGWLSRIADAKLIRSMSRKGYSPDNAACEGFFGRLKAKLFYPCNWQSITLSSSYRPWTPTSVGTTNSGSRSPWALSVPSNTERALDLRRKTSPSFYPPPLRME